MNKFTVAVKRKGWSMTLLAIRWGIKPRQMSNISSAPKTKDWDALEGIPENIIKETTNDKPNKS